MVWEQNTPIIVALCQVVERGRIKCDHYWPYDNEPEWVGSDMNLQMVIINPWRYMCGKCHTRSFARKLFIFYIYHTLHPLF